MRNVYTDLLLFGVQRTENAAMLYFVERNTIDGDIPQLHRLGAPKRVLDRVELGGLYTVSESRKRVLNMEPQKSYRLSAPYYTMLNELRCLKYDKTRYCAEDCLTFEEFRELLAYRCGGAKRFGTAAVCALFYLVGLLLPCALYVFAMFTMMQLRPANPVAIPVMSVGLLPLMVFLIALSFAFCEWALLEIPLTRYALMRRFALETCGVRRPIGVTKKTMNRLVWLGGLSAAAAAVCAAILYIYSIANAGA